MDRLECLRSQAEVLRRLAGSFDRPELRRNLLAIATRCEEMVADGLREEAERQRVAAPWDERL